MVTKTKTIQVDRESILAYICNGCELEFGPWDFEGISVSKMFGYHSRIFGDCTIIEFDLCEKCLEKVVETLKIPPVTNNTLDYPAEEQNNGS